MALRVAAANLRVLGWRHPEWWVVFVASAAWSALTLQQVGERIGGSHLHANLESGWILGSEWAGVLGVAFLMAAAMMSPLVLGTIRHVALTTFWPRRYRAATFFLLAYLVVWAIVGAALTVATVLLSALIGFSTTCAIAFVAAAAWQFTPAKRRALRRCERRISIAGDGWRADVACLRYGAIAGWSCVVTCWAFMAAAAAAGHALPVLGALFALQLHERLAWRFRPRTTGGYIAAVGIIVLSAFALV